ncbi:MAG: hypothetical protein LBP52_02390 [Burkholderiaceae bacterium]|nr:hypothetical protein [Burkholderiaceae bacterium]
MNTVVLRFNQGACVGMQSRTVCKRPKRNVGVQKQMHSILTAKKPRDFRVLRVDALFGREHHQQQTGNGTPALRNDPLFPPILQGGNQTGKESFGPHAC